MVVLVNTSGVLYLDQLKNRHPSYCSCGTSGSNSVPSFVGTCYCCKSSNSLTTHRPQVYTNDTIWVYNRDCWYVLDN